MDLTYHTKWSKPDIIRNIIQYCLYVESKKWYKLTYLQNSNRLIDIENKVMIIKGEGKK